MARKIRFSHRGKNYLVDPEVCDVDRIVLPDGRAIGVLGWIGKNPPVPVRLYHIRHPYYHLPPDEIALKIKAVVAEEI